MLLFLHAFYLTASRIPPGRVVKIGAFGVCCVCDLLGCLLACLFCLVLSLTWSFVCLWVCGLFVFWLPVCRCGCFHGFVFWLSVLLCLFVLFVVWFLFVCLLDC